MAMSIRGALAPTDRAKFATESRPYSPEIKYLRDLNSEQRLPLFVKKSDDEGISFYYLGDVVPVKDSFTQESMPIEAGKSVSVVKLLFRLKHSVPEALYNYLIA